ncbi:MAG: tetratricopeptide repeat protein [Calditrichaeota bacterium]|nr:MAG: tetratricopeptide repeat protein [Calditrichota bacterium]
MLKHFIFFIAVVFSFSSLVAQDAGKRKPEAGQPYNEGNSLVKQKKYEQAIPKYLAAIKADENFPEAYYMLAISYQKTKQYQKAIEAFKNAIKLNSKFEKAYVALGNLQMALEEIPDAINTFKAVLAFNPNSVKANYGLGKIYKIKKDYKQAEQYLKAALAQNANYGRAWNILGMVYDEQKQYAKAIEAYQNALKNARGALKGSYSYRLGVAQINAKRYKDAEQNLKMALKYSRKSAIKAASNFYLGEVYKHTGQKQKALRYYAEAAKNRSWQKAANYEIDLIKNPDKYAY